MLGLIQELATQNREQENFTALGIAVSHGTGPTHIAVSGNRQHKSSVPVQIDDKWHVGSITKSITASFFGKLVDEGILQFDSLISELLPDIVMHEGYANCTVAHLLTHTSGLAGIFPFKVQHIHPTSNNELVEARRKVVEKLLSKRPKAPCGSSHVYSNLGYTVAGHILETLTNIPYEALIKDQLFAPCELMSAGFGAPKGQGPDEQPMGHHDSFLFRKAMNPFDGPADNTPIMAAAGTAHMNLNDLVSYGRLHVEGERGSDRYLKTNTWRTLHKPYKNFYACGWVHEEIEGGKGPAIWHNGSNTYWYAVVVLAPQIDTVLALVTNNGNMAKAERALARVSVKISDQLG